MKLWTNKKIDIKLLYCQFVLWVASTLVGQTFVLVLVICLWQGQLTRWCHLLSLEQLWTLLWSAVLTEALSPVPDIIGVERARKDYEFIMRRSSVLINRRQESGIIMKKKRKGEWKWNKALKDGISISGWQGVGSNLQRVFMWMLVQMRGSSCVEKEEGVIILWRLECIIFPC